jgi:hypothetical protein
MRKIIAAASVLAALAIAPSAFSATVTVTNLNKYGVEVTVAAPYQLVSCTGIAYDANWSAVTSPSATFWGGVGQDDPYYGWLGWTTQSALTAHANVTCTVRHPTSHYERQWRWRTKVRSGPNTSSRSKSGSCYIGNLFGELHLDCWGGAYAQATWRFSLPSDARQVSRAIVGQAGCCEPGTISRSWTGRGGGLHTAKVRVTNWRGFYVEKVRIRYQTKVRVLVTSWVSETATGAI